MPRLNTVSYSCLHLPVESALDKAIWIAMLGGRHFLLNNINPTLGLLRLLFGLDDFVICLDEVSPCVLELNRAFKAVICETAYKLASVLVENPPATDSFVLLPLSVVEIPIQVVVNSCAMTHCRFHVSLVEFAIYEQNFYLTVDDAVPIKPSLDNFVRQSEKDTVTLWLVISPFAFIQSASKAKFAHACPRAHTVFVGTFVDISIFVDHLSCAIPDSLNDLAFINSIFDF